MNESSNAGNYVQFLIYGVIAIFLIVVLVGASGFVIQAVGLAAVSVWTLLAIAILLASIGGLFAGLNLGYDSLTDLAARVFRVEEHLKRQRVAGVTAASLSLVTSFATFAISVQFSSDFLLRVVLTMWLLLLSLGLSLLSSVQGGRGWLVFRLAVYLAFAATSLFISVRLVATAFVFSSLPASPEVVMAGLIFVATTGVILIANAFLIWETSTRTAT